MLNFKISIIMSQGGHLGKKNKNWLKDQFFYIFLTLLFAFLLQVQSI